MVLMAYVFGLTVSLWYVVNVSGQTIDDTTLLHNTLMSGYDKNVRPSLDQSKPVMVNLTFNLVSIKELDEIMGKLSIVGMLVFWWVDPRITWNPFAYNNTYSVRLSMKEVWKPDLVLAHPVDSMTTVGFDQHWYPVRYFYNGIAVWAPGDVMTTTCKIDVTYYPFDTQMCEVCFIPWGALLSEIYLLAAQEEASLKYFTGNGEWSLERATTSAGNIDGMYPVYTVSLEMKRRPTFIIVNVVLPIMFMGLLNVLVFVLPASSGERISFAITVLLAIAVFLTLVGDNMPKTSEPMSTICYFLLTNLVLSSLIMIITILNLNIYHKDSKTAVPRWLSTFVLLLKCKRLPKRTKVENIGEHKDEIQGSDDKKATLEKFEQHAAWALPLYKDDMECVTWQDVSKAIDLVFGVASVLWLLITAASFFIMVATQSVPGKN